MATKLTHLEKILFDALEAAESHLDFCGYGDSYERQCALKCEEPLDKKIEAALTEARKKK